MKFHACSKSDIFNYLVRMLKAPTSLRQYYVVTPPFLKTCKVYDRNRKQLISFNIETVSDYWTVAQVFHDQDYDIQKLTRFVEFSDLADRRLKLAERNLILDLGANIGASAHFLNLKWPNTEFWCFEPSYRNVEILKRNATENMKVFHAAVSGKDGVCTIENPSANPNGFRISDQVSEDCSDSIEMLSMQTIMQKISFAGLKPFILKVDIEGAENEVFRNASDWLEQWPIVMLEIHDWMLPSSGSSASALKAFSEFGRDVIIIGSTLISLHNNRV